MILLVNARLVDPVAGRETSGGLLVAQGAIADVGPHLAAGAGPEGAAVIDCRGQVVAPGLVDLQAFIGEPGAEHRETLSSASRGAAAGGITTLVCRPDTDPVIDDPAIVDFVLRRARAASAVRIHPCAALTKGLAGREMTEIGLLKEAGAVAFGDAHRSVMNAQVMRRAMVYARDRDAVVSHFTQDANLAAEGSMNEGEFASRLGLPSIPKVAETIMLERDLALARITGVRYHAALISCAQSVETIRRAKDEGLAVTCGVSVNHLTLNEGDVGDYRTFLKLSPPLRSEEDRQAIGGCGSGRQGVQQARQRDLFRMDEAQGGGEHRLEANRAIGGFSERLALRLDVLRIVIGDDGVDHALSEASDQRLPILLRAQRRR